MDSLEKRKIIITGTLTEVLFTIIVLGGSTYPLIKFLKITGDSRHRTPSTAPKKGPLAPGEQVVTLSKTEHASAPIESEFSSFYDTDLSSDSQSDPEQSTFIHDENGDLIKHSPRKRRRRKKGRKGDTSTESHTVTSAFTRLDATFLVPFLCRRVTREELISNRTQMRQFASRWYDEVRSKKPMQWVKSR